MKKAEHAAVQHATECGRLLNEAKASVPHGGWTEWVRERCAFSMRTAQLYMRLSDHLADDFTKALELDPKNSGNYTERGKAYDGGGRTAQAVDDYSRALAADPENVEALKLRGLAERKLGQQAAALDDLNKYQLVHPDDVDAAAALAALRNGRY